MKINKLLVTIFLVGFVLRIWNVSTLPPALNWDEVSHGFNAYSILKTGTDEWGEPYPFIFRAYGDYKLPVYIYTTVLSVASFGLNEFAVRLPSVLAGSFSVIFLYFLVKELTKREDVSLISALLFAAEPWNLFLSRIAVEANLSLFYIISGFYFLIKSLNKKSNNLIIGALLLSLSVWTYNSARIFVPLILFTFAFIYQKLIFKYIVKKRASFVLTLIILAGFLGTMFFQLISTEGTARYENVKLLNQGAINEIISAREQNNLPLQLNKLVNNRYVYFSSKFVSNYFNHFSIDYLFKNGGDNYQFNVPGQGLLFAIDFPFVIIGAIYLLTKYRNKNYVKLIFSWILLAPVASSLVREAPHALRNIVMIPAIFVISAFGLVYSIKIFRHRKSFVKLILIIYILLFARYMNTYTNDYKIKYSSAWQFGNKQIASFIDKNYDKYDKFIITKKYGEPHEFLLFYLKWDPKSFIKDENLVRFYQTNWYWVDKFDKFYFTNEWDIPANQSMDWFLESGEEVDIDGDVVLITSPGKYPENWQVLETIKYLNGEIAYEIVTK